MESIDNLIILLEKDIDAIVKDAKEMEPNIKLLLNEMNIQCNLDTVLSFILGTIFMKLTIAHNVNIYEYNEKISREEVFEKLKPMIRRSIIYIKEEFLSTRLIDNG